MLYLDIQNVYNFQANTAPNLLRELNDNGNPKVINNPNGPNKYDLKKISTNSGTILPTLGIMIEILNLSLITTPKYHIHEQIMSYNRIVDYSFICDSFQKL